MALRYFTKFGIEPLYFQLSAVHHLQGSFEETMSYSRYHPSKGYWWDFKPNKSGLSPFNASLSSAPKEVASAPKEEPSTLFQRQRVDMLLAELVRQFPLPTPNATQVCFCVDFLFFRLPITKPPLYVCLSVCHVTRLYLMNCVS